MSTLTQVKLYERKRRYFIPSALSVAFGTIIGSMPSTSTGAILEEIIVSAQQRDERLQDVPISVNVVSGDAIRDTGATDMEAITQSLPSVTVAKTLSGDQLMIRGVGSGGNPGFQQSVGTFVDGIYMGKGQQSRSKFLDIERFEVLRGPQSIYFGNNTIGGAMNIHTKKPGDEFNVDVTAYTGPEDGEYNIEAAAGGPLSDTFGVRVAYSHTELDGFMRDLGTGEDTPNQEGDTGRIVFAWAPTFAFDATLKIELGTFEQDGENYQIIDCPAPAPFGNSPSCSPATIATPGFEADFDTNGATGGVGAPAGTEEFFNTVRNTLDTDNVALKLDWQLGEHTLTSITGYSSYDSLRFVDPDSGPRAIIQSRRNEDFEQLSQELRLLSPTEGTYSYIVGAYIESTEFDFRNTQKRNFGPGATIDTFNFEESDTWSVFGAVTWNISDSLRTILGIRYTEVDKDARHVQEIFKTDGTPAGPPNLGFVAGRGFDPHDFSNSRSDDDLTPSIIVQWDATPDVMLYASFAQGFKAGGFDPLTTNSSTNLSGGGYAFEPEEVDAFELGFKTTLLDESMELTAALFRSEYSDLQVTTFNTITTTFIVANAAESISQGLEIDGRWAATDALTVNFAFMFLDAYYDSYPNATCTVLQADNFGPGCVQDLTDGQLLYAPDYAGNISVEYAIPVSDGLEIKTNLTLNFSDSFSYVGDNDPRYEEDSFEKIDLRVALADTEGVWEVAVVGRNITDEFTSHYGGDLPVGTGAGFTYLDRPRTVALQAKYNF